jgi:hypothetical protein
MIRDVFHNGADPKTSRSSGFQQDQYRGVIIDGARRFICPDTLH